MQNPQRSESAPPTNSGTNQVPTATGKPMTTINDAIEFTVPTWSLCYFINGDRDGYTEGDLQLLDSFVQKLADEYGNAALMLPPDEMCDSYFSWRNDVHSLGDTVTTLYLQPTI